jgi:hypothetical protein
VYRLQETIAAVINARGLSGTPLGSFTTSAAVIGGRKRSRLRFELDASQIERSLGPEAVHRTPKVYDVSLDSNSVPFSRVLCESHATHSFFGAVGMLGQLKPDMSHPSYVAFSDHRKHQQQLMAANKKTTKLASDDILLAAASAPARDMQDSTQSASGSTSRVSAAGLAGTARSIFDLFERGAYWSIKELVEATGRKEV